MKSRIFLTTLLLMFSIPSVNALNTVETIVYDFNDLKQAISEANERPLDTATIIYFRSPILVPNDNPLPPIKARMNFEPAEFMAQDGGPEHLIQVEPTGILGVRDAVFSGWNQGAAGPVLFENHGDLVLRRITFDTVVGYRDCGKFHCIDNETAVIENMTAAKLLLDRVRVFDQGVHAAGIFDEGPQNRILSNEGRAELVRNQFYLSHKRMRKPIFNSGSLYFQNSSFMVANPMAIPELSLLDSAEGAEAQSANSVFDGFVGDFCAVVTSSGHNTTSAHDCSWSAAGDMVGVQTGLIWRAIDSKDYAKNLVPSAASPLVDTADPYQCPTENPGYPDGVPVWDGNNDGEAICDRGAWELKPTSLAEGGINGFFYNPDADGHYVYIQETDFTTLVMWNTFDSEGRQAWVYGTGELQSGRAVIAEAYINRTEGLTPEGLVSGVEAQKWGQLIVELESCAIGWVDYQSALPEFGSGHFPIERLAYVKQLGCNDPD